MKKCLVFLFFTFSLFQVSTAQSDSDSPVAEIEFDESSFDFGTISSGEKVGHVFTFTNTGDVPLVIVNAKGSCGCTVPFFPKVPIMPGESSEIEVEFDSKNKYGMQSKRVTITANTEPVNIFLTMKGEVEKATDDDLETAKEIVAQKDKIRADLQTLDKSCFAIFPNPTQDYVQVQLKDYIGQSAQIEIRNEMGQIMMNQNVPQISNETTRFEVNQYPPGMYLISISVNGEQPMTQCFVVTRT
ncbi:MAG: DUF1573 domain-containing protein [Bacteroidota bacterium]